MLINKSWKQLLPNKFHVLLRVANNEVGAMKYEPWFVKKIGTLCMHDYIEWDDVQSWEFYFQLLWLKHS